MSEWPYHAKSIEKETGRPIALYFKSLKMLMDWKLNKYPNELRCIITPDNPDEPISVLYFNNSEELKEWYEKNKNRRF